MKENATTNKLYAKGVQPGQWPFGRCEDEVTVSTGNMDNFVVYLKSYTLKLKESNCRCVTEGNFRGKTVTLGKPMVGESSKYKVYMRNPNNGETVKVNFGKK